MNIESAMIRNHYIKRRIVKPYRHWLLFFLFIGLFFVMTFFLSPNHWLIEIFWLVFLAGIIYFFTKIFRGSTRLAIIIVLAIVGVLLLRRFELLSWFSMGGLMLALGILWYVIRYANLKEKN